MKSGFEKTLDSILREWGMRTDGVMGATISADRTNRRLLNMGYRVTRGKENYKYGFIYISELASDIETIIRAYNKVDYGCIVLFRPCCPEILDVLLEIGTVYTYEYGKDKIIGVLVKTI